MLVGQFRVPHNYSFSFRLYSLSRVSIELSLRKKITEAIVISFVPHFTIFLNSAFRVFLNEIRVFFAIVPHSLFFLNVPQSAFFYCSAFCYCFAFRVFLLFRIPPISTVPHSAFFYCFIFRFLLFCIPRFPLFRLFLLFRIPRFSSFPHSALFYCFAYLKTNSAFRVVW